MTEWERIAIEVLDKIEHSNSNEKLNWLLENRPNVSVQKIFPDTIMPGSQDAWYGETFRCPRCGEGDLARYFKYCPDCGIPLLFVNEVGEEEI